MFSDRPRQSTDRTGNPVGLPCHETPTGPGRPENQMRATSHENPTGGSGRPAGSGLRADTRGVQWTLEAFLAVLLLLAALVVVAAVLPVGTQQAEAEIARTQLQQAGDDVLALAEAEGNLTAAVLYWNTTEGEFVGAGADLGAEPHYVTFSGGGEHPLAAVLAGTLEERHVAYNIHIEYETGGVAPVTERRPVVYQGPPGGDSVTASTTVLLFDDDRPHASAGNCTLAELDDDSACGAETFYAPDVDPTSNRYNTVQVQIELWRV